MFCIACGCFNDVRKLEVSELYGNVSDINTFVITVCDHCLKKSNLWCHKHNAPKLLMQDPNEQSNPGTMVFYTACNKCAIEAVLELSDDVVAAQMAMLRRVCPPDFVEQLRNAPSPFAFRHDPDRNALYKIHFANAATAMDSVEESMFELAVEFNGSPGSA